MSSLISPNCLLFQIDQISFEERNKNPVSYPDGVPKITSQDSRSRTRISWFKIPPESWAISSHLEWVWVSVEGSSMCRDCCYWNFCKYKLRQVRLCVRWRLVKFYKPIDSWHPVLAWRARLWVPSREGLILMLSMPRFKPMAAKFLSAMITTLLITNFTICKVYLLGSRFHLDE